MIHTIHYISNGYGLGISAAAGEDTRTNDLDHILQENAWPGLDGTSGRKPAEPSIAAKDRKEGVNPKLGGAAGRQAPINVVLKRSILKRSGSRTPTTRGELHARVAGIYRRSQQSIDTIDRDAETA